MTLGVGTDQMSRVGSTRIAGIRVQNADLTLVGSAVVSDTFLSSRDSLDVVVDTDASCATQPGGSVCDDEVIVAADERNVAMTFTGMRHLHH